MFLQSVDSCFYFFLKMFQPLFPPILLLLILKSIVCQSFLLQFFSLFLLCTAFQINSIGLSSYLIIFFQLYQFCTLYYIYYNFSNGYTFNFLIFKFTYFSYLPVFDSQFLLTFSPLVLDPLLSVPARFLKICMLQVSLIFSLTQT